MTDYEILLFTAENAADAAETERRCFSEPWSVQAFTEALRQENTELYFAVCGGAPAGHIVFTDIGGECSLMTVAVRSEYRRRGIAGALLERLIASADGSAALEVRPTNAAAIALYEKYGFKTAGRRRNFYIKPTEDALIMIKESKPELILAVESSCDETSVSVVRMPQREVLSNKVASQIAIHRLYGGVVPEIASRAHTEAVTGLTAAALSEAGVGLGDIDSIGVTYTPGLIGALLVGVNFAKGLAFASKKSLIPVNHIHGHIAAAYITNPALKPPFLALVASGGHTSLVEVSGYTDFKTVGRTRDDAVGEAFDKVARVIGLPYPGGADMDRLAYLGKPDAVRFPSAAIQGDNLDFSFSGLKTAVINHINTEKMRGCEIKLEDIAACFTSAVTHSITKKLRAALLCSGMKKLVVSGGVAANSHLRRTVAELCKELDVGLYLPDTKLCGDNAAMIAVQAYYNRKNGISATTSISAEV